MSAGHNVITSPGWHARRRAFTRTDAVGFGDAAAFVVALVLPFQFAVGGRVLLSELILLSALPFLLDDGRRRGIARVSQSVVALGLVWLLALMLSDVYRATRFHDYSRGWANVAFLLVNFAALSLLIEGRWRRVTLFAAGLAVGGILQFYVNPSTFAVSEPWKFGYGAPLTLLGVLLASRPSVYKRPVVASGILIALGVINLRMDFRSLAGICLVTAVVVLLAARSARLIRFGRPSLRPVAILIACALAGLVIVQGYAYSARSGWLGVKAEQKYELQRSNLGVLLSGRPQIIAALHAIRDSPIVGHGSWAKDPKYAADLRHELQKAGYHGSTGLPTQDTIPTHSHLLGAWVGAGILGSCLWLWALAIAVSLLPRLYRLGDGRLVLVAFLGLSFVWDVLFSPLGAGQRLSTAFSLVVLLLARKELASDTCREGIPNVKIARSKQ